MAHKKRSEEFTGGQERLEEIRRRLGSAFGTTTGGGGDTGGLFGGLGNLISQLGRLAEQAEASGGEFTTGGESQDGAKKPFKAVYGFSVKSGLGTDKPKVEAFGNVHRDSDGKGVEVQEIREPMVDIFDETDRVLVVVEVPGIRSQDVKLEIHDDVLMLDAQRGENQYRKELLLPEAFSPGQMTYACHNGVLEIRLRKGKTGS
jgi:HSP20 family protein